jgi:proteasome lid subunit RPN8/RPN11/molybdopterin converting factor small subunit
MPTVSLPQSLRDLTGGAAEAQAAGATLRELLGSLEARFPGIAERLMAERGRLRPYLTILVGERDVRQLGGLDALLAEDALVTILPAIAGGSGKAGRASARRSAILPAEALAALAREAERAWPEEACGLILARGESEARLVPLANAIEPASRWRAFAADPAQLLAALQAAEKAGERLVGIYHSHCDGDAGLSPLDEAAALDSEGRPLWPGVALVVVAVEAGRAGEARAYRWEAGGFRRLALALGSVQIE